MNLAYTLPVNFTTYVEHTVYGSLRLVLHLPTTSLLGAHLAPENQQQAQIDALVADLSSLITARGYAL